jgi:hypothetical protein
MIRPTLLGEMVSYAVIGHLWAIWATPKEPKKVLKGPQVDRMYGPMSKLKDKSFRKK